MGLDMFLYKRTYIGNNYRKADWNPDPFVPISPELEAEGIKADRLSEVTELVGQWRKANAIHDWFVQQCADGVDECQPIEVELDKLRELRSLCTQVLFNKSLAPSLLPTTSGFFFGGTEYDEWYERDVEYTVTVIDDLLAEIENRKSWWDCTVVYQASW